MWRFSIFISNIGSKYVLLVVNHTNTNSEDSKGLASAWSGDRIRTPNILRTPIKQLARTPLLHHSSICIVFGASWVQQLSILCVERYGMIHRIWKGGKSCVQSRFQHFSTTKSSSCHYCRSTKLLVFTPQLLGDHIDKFLCNRWKISEVVSNLLAAPIFIPHRKILHVENLFDREQTTPVGTIERSNIRKAKSLANNCLVTWVFSSLLVKGLPHEI